MREPMNLRRSHLLATAAVAIAIAGTAGASTLTFADFDDPLGSGTLGGVGFTITATGPSGTGLDTITSKNYNGAAWGSLGSSVQNLETIQYSGQTVTITFDQPVNDLELWLYSWRAGGNGSTPYGGADRYLFSQDFALGANFSNGTKSATATLSTPTGWWSDGILSFSGPVTSISWTSYDDFGSIDPVDGQGFTFTGTVSASAVPGAGLAGLATVGLAGVARRRRR